MTCQELADFLLEYLNGELAEDCCAGIRGHLDACPHCVHFVQTYQLTIQITRRLPAAPLPPELQQRLHRAIDDKGERRKDEE